MNFYQLLTISLFGLLLNGCDRSPSEPPKQEKSSPILFKEQRQALDKAKGVQQILDQRTAETDKELEKQEK